MQSYEKVDLMGPLFVEPTDDIVRSDAFSGPYGFLLGPWGPPSKLELAQQYFDAANTLVEDIRCQRIEDYKLVNPVLFLYRHALELVVKHLIRSNASHHKLNNLADDLEVFARQRYNQKVPSWITGRLKEIAKVDPGSMAFRYAEDKYNGDKKPSAVDSDIYVSLTHLQRSMTALYEVLSKAAMTVDGT